MIIKNISFSFGDKKIFDGLDLEISSPVTCITADNGKGKTTLLRIMAGLVEPTGGHIEGLPERPAVCFQEDRLLPRFSILENVKAVCGSREKASYWLERLGLDGRFDERPDALSGGMCRRVALARAFAYDGDMLLLDEPLKGIDPANRQIIYDILREQKIPVVISAHSSDEFETLKPEIIRI